MSDKEDEIISEIKKISELAKQNKNVDAGALVESLLSQKSSQNLSGGEIAKAYLVSLLIPLFGIYYAVRFWFRPESNAKKTAIVCLVLTVISSGLFLWIANAILSSALLQSIQNINPEQIRELTQ